MALAEAYKDKFSYRSKTSHGGSSEKVYRESLYDYLYEHDYQAGFCNASQKVYGIRGLKEWFLKIHTGETLYEATPNWSWEKRWSLGQVYLKDLARDILDFYSQNLRDQWSGEKYRRYYEEITRRLEIDGYVFKDGQLYQTEPDILNVDQELSLLERLYESLALVDRETTFEFFKLSEEHYVSGKWSDSIANSRKFLEAVLQQVASRYSSFNGTPINERLLDHPVEVRAFLEKEGLVEKKEREAIDKIYALLSHTGSHPYMAEKDQARLLRQICLTTTQFIMLRLEGALSVK